MTDQFLQVADDLGRSGQVRLVDHEDIGDLEDAGLDDLDGVAARRRRDHHGGVGRLHDLELGLADTDGLEQASIAAGRIEEADRLACGGGEPSEVAASRHAADEYTGVERVPDHSHPISEDRPAGKGAGGIDSDDADLVSAGPPALDDLVAEGALAAPRGAGHPDNTSQAGTFANLTEEVGDPGIPVLDHPDRTSQRARVSRHEAFGELGFGHRGKSTGAPSSSRPP